MGVSAGVWAAPIIVVGILFIALFLISIGLDEIANPRLRRRCEQVRISFNSTVGGGPCWTMFHSV